MIAKLLDAVFGCHHSRYSFPMTSRLQNRSGSSPKATYVVCLDCGREFPYDWKQMKVLTPGARESATVGTFATKEAA
jgi:hypothetical protein